MTVLDRALSWRQGSFSALQRGVDEIVGGFIDRATDWCSLASMTAGGIAYRVGRVGALGLGTGRSVRALSVGLGLGSEVSTFEITHRGLTPHPENSNLWRWSGPLGLRQGLLQSFITFGALKSAGHWARAENVILRHLLQDTAMVAGHQISAALNLTPRPTGSLAEQYLYAEAMNLQVGAGMALAGRMAPGISSLERGLSLSFPSPRGGGRRAELNILGRDLAWAAAAEPLGGEKTPEQNPSSLRPFQMAAPPSGRGGGTSLSALSIRRLVHEIRESNDTEAAQELAARAQKEPRLFYQAYELAWIVGALATPRDPKIEENLLLALKSLVGNSWGIFDEFHLQLLIEISKDRHTLATDLSPLIKKLNDLRPDIAFAAALREMAPEFPLSEVGRSGLSVTEPRWIPKEGEIRYRHKKVRITAESIEFDDQIEFHSEPDAVVRILPRRFHGDLVKAESEPEPAESRLDTSEWNSKIAKALGRVKAAKKGAFYALVGLLKDYVEEPASDFSFQSALRLKRFDQLSADRDPALRAALRHVGVDWLVEGAKADPSLRFSLQHHARLGHPGALMGLVDLANRGYRFARPLLRELEMRRILEAVSRGEVLAQADLVSFLSLKDLTEGEADVAAAGLLRVAETAFARNDKLLSEFAFAKLYDLSLSPRFRQKIFERIHPYEGDLFQTLREGAGERRLGAGAKAFLGEAARMSSYEALEILIAAAPQDREIRDQLRRIFREIPKESLPEVLEFKDTRLPDGEEMALHVALRKQKIRKRLLQFLEQDLRGEDE